MKRIALVVSMLAAPVAMTVQAAELAECALISDGGKRLACYDALAKATSPAAASLKEREETFIRDDVIDRCQSQMGSFGASMVKACVDEDLSAYRTLQTLLDAHGAVIDRCSGQMARFGWSMVLACSKEDIEAERALKRMRN